MCDCNRQPVLIDISNNYTEFRSRLDIIDAGNWVLLMSCPECNQLWKVDEWDKYQTCYAVKIPAGENWEAFDSESLIKDQIIINRGGLSKDACMWKGCNSNQVKGSAYCIDHLWDTGTRS